MNSFIIAESMIDEFGEGIKLHIQKKAADQKRIPFTVMESQTKLEKVVDYFSIKHEIKKAVNKITKQTEKSGNDNGQED